MPGPKSRTVARDSPRSPAGGAVIAMRTRPPEPPYLQALSSKLSKTWISSSRSPGTITGTWIASKILWLALALGLSAGDHWSAAVGRPEGVR